MSRPENYKHPRAHVPYFLAETSKKASRAEITVKHIIYATPRTLKLSAVGSAVFLVVVLPMPSGLHHRQCVTRTTKPLRVDDRRNLENGTNESVHSTRRNRWLLGKGSHPMGSHEAPASPTAGSRRVRREDPRYFRGKSRETVAISTSSHGIPSLPEGTPMRYNVPTCHPFPTIFAESFSSFHPTGSRGKSRGFCGNPRQSLRESWLPLILPRTMGSCGLPWVPVEPMVIVTCLKCILAPLWSLCALGFSCKPNAPFLKSI